MMSRKRMLLWLPLLVLAALTTAYCDTCDDDPPPPNFFQQVMQQTAEAAQKARTIAPGTAAPPPSTPTRSPSATPTDIPGLDYAKISPIKAVFDEDAKSTTYTLSLSGPFYAGAQVYWSGPNCGSVSDSASAIKATPNLGDPRPPFRDEKSVFTWSHPHPPCGDTTNHADVTIVATIYESTRIVVCTYPGSATGTGPECFRR